APADDWRAWLHDACSRDGVDLVDPTARMIRVQERGQDVFFDHLTDTGHEALAAELVAWFRDRSLTSTH
ncbi:MAG TPA: hypothetical protein VFU38_06375, partial [Candidatus Krumholzibacteria bacterium]|nr:hypothetical protein [Candidatus Krumholzibacteria bacterium]